MYDQNILHKSKLEKARRLAWLRLFFALFRPKLWSLMFRIKKERYRNQVANKHLNDLQRLLEHVREGVPYYKSFFEKNKTKDRIKLRDLPILKKDNLQRFFPDLIFRDSPPGSPQGSVFGKDLYITRTSGSTGAPCSHLKSTSDELYWNIILTRRLFQELNLPFTGHIFDLGLHWHGQPWLEISVLPGLYFSWNFRTFTVDDEEIYAEILSLLTTANPTIIYGTPSRISALADICEKEKIQKSPKIILTSYEQLSKSTRNHLEGFFGCRVISVYGTAETGICGWECSHGRIHFEGDVIIPEILKENGQHCLPGETGRIIITSLKSWTMPILRYETGDLATLPSYPCECGKKSLCIEKIEGRQTDVIQTKKGRQYSAFRLFEFMDDLNIRNYQFVQEILGELQIILPQHKSLQTTDLSLLEKKVSDFLSEDTKIVVKNTGDFILTPLGKRNPMVRNNSLC